MMLEAITLAPCQLAEVNPCLGNFGVGKYCSPFKFLIDTHIGYFQRTCFFFPSVMSLHLREVVNSNFIISYNLLGYAGEGHLHTTQREVGIVR